MAAKPPAKKPAGKPNPFAKKGAATGKTVKCPECGTSVPV